MTEKSVEPSINFYHDSAAQAESTNELRSIPHIALEELIFRHENDLDNEFGVIVGGQGHESVGLIVRGANGEKTFFKIFKGVVPFQIMKDFLQKAGVRREDFNDNKDPKINDGEFNMYLSDLAGREASTIKLSQTTINKILSKAFAIKKGNEILPNRVPELKAILTWDGIPAGFSTEYIQGPAEPIDEENAEYAADIQFLKTQNLHVDSFIDANNAIREPNGNIKFLDLLYTGELK
ncbi:MAG: hypothetical protein ABI425_03860 [Patescibacteria group bacterium]